MQHHKSYENNYRIHFVLYAVIRLCDILLLLCARRDNGTETVIIECPLSRIDSIQIIVLIGRNYFLCTCGVCTLYYYTIM